MTLVQGIILGILQGLTEFLPVSSSGHLVLGQLLFGLQEAQLVFDVSVHMGTLLAVLVVYRTQIMSILASILAFLAGMAGKSALKMSPEQKLDLNMAAVIILGSIPTALIGLYLKKFEHTLFSSALIVGCMLLCTGILLFFSKRFYASDQTEKPVPIVKGILIGISQGIAVLPGMSRSGTTIACGMFLGLDRAKAATLSFLLSIPAIMGAQILSIKDMVENGMTIDAVIMWATLVSFLTGFIALKLLIKLVNAGRFHLFAPYCFVLGAMAIGFHFFQ